MGGSDATTVRRWQITTWPEGFVVESHDSEHALVEAIAAIEADGYLLCAVEIEEGDER